jgi:hypothetical protein
MELFGIEEPVLAAPALVRQRWAARDRQGQWWRLVPVPGRNYRYRLIETGTSLALTGHDGYLHHSTITTA